MRIIAGELKGRRLETPPESERIRPTTERVKEAVFSMAAPYLEDALVVDLFTGTGNLGLEAISRGARYVIFGDKSRKSLALAERNIRHCGVLDKSTLILGDWEQVLRRIKQPQDVFFLDPPYADGILFDCIQKISESDMLTSEGIIVAEHSVKEDLPEDIGSFERLKRKRYGNIVISIYSKKSEEQ